MELVIDGDGHFVEPARIWSEYVDPKWRDRIFFAVERASQGAQAAQRGWSLGESTDAEQRDDLVERFVVDDIEATGKKIERNGGRFHPIDTNQMATETKYRDPDGIVFDITGPAHLWAGVKI